MRPLTSVREAEFLHNEIPGIHIPDRVLTRMTEAEAHGEDAARAEGLSIALEVFEAIRDSLWGIHVHVAGGNLGGALELLSEIRDSV